VIKLRSSLGLKPCVCFDGAEKACGEWRVTVIAGVMGILFSFGGFVMRL
jgi:hypothetical protein